MLDPRDVGAARRSADRTRRAYAFYATDAEHALAVLVFAQQLRRLGAGRGVEMVVLHLWLPEPMIAALQASGVRTREVAPLGDPLGGYYRHALLKLRVLALDEYRRVVFADVDALPVRGLDFLFDLPLRGAVAAPPAYWLPGDVVTSALFVAEPSAALWRRVEARVQSLPPQSASYDMDILNEELGGEIERLSAGLLCLDSEWEDAGREGAFAACAAPYRGAAVVHFTALGKPWSYSPEETRRLRPRARPTFHALRDAWWKGREEVLRSTGWGPELAGPRVTASAYTIDPMNAGVLHNATGSMDLDHHPVSTEGLEIEESGDGFIVYQPDRDRIHYLNHTAAMVLELSRGELSAAEIAVLLARAYALREPPHQDLAQVLAELEQEGLVRWRENAEPVEGASEG